MINKYREGKITQEKKTREIIKEKLNSVSKVEYLFIEEEVFSSEHRGEEKI